MIYFVLEVGFKLKFLVLGFWVVKVVVVVDVF